MLSQIYLCLLEFFIDECQFLLVGKIHNYFIYINFFKFFEFVLNLV